MAEEEEVKEGVKKSMSEPAQKFKKSFQSGLHPKETEDLKNKLPRNERLKIMRDAIESQPKDENEEWEDKFRRNRG